MVADALRPDLIKIVPTPERVRILPTNNCHVTGSDKNTTPKNTANNAVSNVEHETRLTGSRLSSQ